MTTISNYRPIACARHSEFELLAMQRHWIDARLQGSATRQRVRVVDVLTRDRAEYLVVVTESGNRLQWRLDTIVEFAAAPPETASSQ